EPCYGRPSFKQLLTRIHEVWQQQRDAVLHQAHEITALIRQDTDRATTREPILLSPEPLRLGRQQFERSFDPIHGGYGGTPKFPRPVVFEFLLRVGSAESVLFTLRQMGRGGIFDQLGGGFHRYSVDERWLVPHFEKMLYDQAQLLRCYCDAWLLTRDDFFADIARRTCEYVLRDLTDPAGGFYAAEDADSEGMEGRFYIWRKSEIPNEAVCDY
ncbi:MAG: thioredoxin domain-containing protein, partial [Acidobacteriota bacterium]|nr:thioredoxin domain-containing protein [Acidobacteriota bacterium]